MLPRRAAAQRAVRGGALVLAAGLSACASQLQVRSLATERADREAYELSGSDPEVLRHEALQLCPQGADILRQAVQGRRPEPGNVAAQQSIRSASALFEPPSQSAQLVVLCLESPRGMMLSAAKPAAPPASAGVSAPGTAAPTGPVTMQW